MKWGGAGVGEVEVCGGSVEEGQGTSDGWNIDARRSFNMAREDAGWSEARRRRRGGAALQRSAAARPPQPAPRATVRAVMLLRCMTLHSDAAWSGSVAGSVKCEDGAAELIKLAKAHTGAADIPIASLACARPLHPTSDPPRRFPHARRCGGCGRAGRGGAGARGQRRARSRATATPRPSCVPGPLCTQWICGVDFPFKAALVVSAQLCLRAEVGQSLSSAHCRCADAPRPAGTDRPRCAVL